MRVDVQPAQPDCDPVGINSSLIEQDGGQRVIASTDNGLVLSALDTPIVPQLIAAPRRPWAAGASWDPMGHRAGVWIERDLARLRIRRRRDAGRARGADGDSEGGVAVVGDYCSSRRSMCKTDAAVVLGVPLQKHFNS